MTINSTKLMMRLYLILPVALILTLGACGSNNIVPPITSSTSATPVPSEIIETQPETEFSSDGLELPEQGYPVIQANEDSGYIAPPTELELAAEQEPQDPIRELPAADAQNGVIGGVLIQFIEGTGYIPLNPIRLALGDILLSDTGEKAYVRSNESSLEAQLLPTGVFIFQNVPPGEYGIMVDLGFTQFIAPDDSGEPLIVLIEPGDVIDLGQVITQLDN